MCKGIRKEEKGIKKSSFKAKNKTSRKINLREKCIIKKKKEKKVVLTVKKRSMTLWSRRVSLQESVGLSMTF